jgi:prevent-host-death family protein
MGAAIAAAEANRRFSEVLRHVREGHSYVVTSHGRAVARIVPVRPGDAVTARGRAALLRRLEKTPVVDVGRWTREELYE